MTRRGSKGGGKDKMQITRIWIAHGVASIDGSVSARPEAPETKALLDRVVAWTLEYLRGHGLEVASGHDGPLRTLDFESEADCLEAHDRLVAATDQQQEFRLHFVLRPSGVTILVVS